MRPDPKLRLKCILDPPRGIPDERSNEDDNLLIWVPNEYRAYLWSLGTLVLVGREPIDINFGDAYHGIDWTRCITL